MTDCAQIGVAGLVASTFHNASTWVLFSADCARPLRDRKELEQIQQHHGFDPAIFWASSPHLISPIPAGYRTFWYARNTREEV